MKISSSDSAITSLVFWKSASDVPVETITLFSVALSALFTNSAQSATV
ncbi:Uncharacterised protein [Vibrio cholerae]|nr:Uncharacterised protein [Vibrio cholerae]